MARKGHVKVYLDLIDKGMRTGVTRVSSMLTGLRRNILSLGGALTSVAVLYGFKKVLDASNEQIAAMTKLRASFKGVGGISEESARGLESYAESLQQVTRFGDEQITRAQAMLGTFSISTESARKLTMGMLDMAEATSSNANGVADLTAVSLTLGKALTGQTGMLARYGIVMSEAQRKVIQLGDEEERVATITQVLEQNFGGAALAMGQTFSGALARLKNGFGDVLESMGMVITKSGALKTVINSLADMFGNFSRYLVVNMPKAQESVRRFILNAVVGLRVMGTMILDVTGFLAQMVKALTLIARAAPHFVLLKKLGIDAAENLDNRLQTLGNTMDGLTETTARWSKKTADALDRVAKKVATSKLTIAPFSGGGGGQGVGNQEQPGAGGAAGATAGAPVTISGQMETASGGIDRAKVALDAVLEKMNTWIGQLTTVADLCQNTIQASISTIGEGIAGEIVDGTYQWVDAMKAVLKQIIATIVKMTIELGIALAIAAATGGGGAAIPGLGKYMMGGKGHKGAFVGFGKLLPTYHSGTAQIPGLRRDETVGILQAGEGVMQRSSINSIGRENFAYMNRTGQLPQAGHTFQFNNTIQVGDSLTNPYATRRLAQKLAKDMFDQFQLLYQRNYALG